MQKILPLIFATFLLALKPLAVFADSKHDCITGGKVFQDAMRSNVLSIAYGERSDWRRVDYYSLPKKMQASIETDVSKMLPAAESIVANVQKDVPEWKRQGMDGDHMANEILMRGIKDLGENYAIRCLKAHQEEEKAPDEKAEIKKR